jgi:pilus assembly protein CpaB
MKLLKNKLVIGTLCILLGLLFSFVALPALFDSGPSAEVSAVRMKVPVQAGAQITAEMVEIVSVPEHLAGGNLRDIASAVGQYANADLYAGDYLTAAKLSVVLPERHLLSAGEAKGRTVVSVTLPSLASGVSGRLLPGDIATVIAIPKGTENQTLGIDPETEPVNSSGALIYPELEYIEVCMITANDGTDAEVNARPDEEAANTLPVTVSFYATREQALKLAELEQQGVIHIVFVARGEAALKYMPDAVLTEMEVN